MWRRLCVATRHVIDVVRRWRMEANESQDAASRIGLVDFEAAMREKPRRMLPRQVGDFSPVPSEARHCAECNCSPPTRWWLMIDFIQQPRTELTEKHAPNNPVFLCDACTGITPDMVAEMGERTRRDDIDWAL